MDPHTLYLATTSAHQGFATSVHDFVLGATLAISAPCSTSTGGIDVTPLTNLLGILTVILIIVTIAMVGPAIAKAGLQWTGGGGLLGDEHSVRGAMSTVKSSIGGGVLAGSGAIITLILTIVIKNIGGCTGT